MRDGLGLALPSQRMLPLDGIMLIFLKLLWALAVFWHVLAFCQGGYCVLKAYHSLFGGEWDSTRKNRIRLAEWHLWASGVAIIILGIALGGRSYLENPKLWAKLVVITIWLASSIFLGLLATLPPSSKRRSAMLLLCAVSGACWLYGAFIGGAKSLANGVVPFSTFMIGFVAVVATCIFVTFYFERQRTASSFSALDHS